MLINDQRKTRSLSQSMHVRELPVLRRVVITVSCVILLRTASCSRLSIEPTWSLRSMLQSSGGSASPDISNQETNSGDPPDTPATPTPPAPGAGTLRRATNVVFLSPGNSLAQFQPPAPVTPTETAATVTSPAIPPPVFPGMAASASTGTTAVTSPGPTGIVTTGSTISRTTGQTHISQADLGTGTSEPFPGQQVNAQPQLISVSLVQPATATADETSASLGGSLAGSAAAATVSSAGTVGGGRAGSFPG